MDKPKNIHEYIEWAKATLDTDFSDPKCKRLYESNLRNLFNSVSGHDFFVNFGINIQKWEQEYNKNTQSNLFTYPTSPELLQKCYKSALDKSFRINVLWNKNFPKEPKKGWVTTNNLFYYFNDLIRGTLVCRFIDGPKFVAKKMAEYAKSLNLECSQYSQQRDEGYYAYHFYVKLPVILTDINWEESTIELNAEIQITTQLQDVLRSLTHKFYEENRLSPDNESTKWKWEFDSNRFRLGYLSHTLHLLESIILESRNKVIENELKHKNIEER